MTYIAPLDAISRPMALANIVRPEFTWTPTLSDFTYPDTASDSGAPKTALNTAITFTQAVILPPADPTVTVIAYEWDMGDGTHLRGPSVVHTYTIANPQVRVTLCVMDSNGVRRCIGHQLILT